MKRILVVDDDPHLRDVVVYTLQRDGHAVTPVQDGRAALDALFKPDGVTFDLVVLDILMPEVDGLEVCRRLRASPRAHTPVVFLSSRDEEVDKIVGLELGGDDYVTKPFSPKELVARVRAVLRRRSPHLAGETVDIKGLLLNPATHRVAAADQPIELGPTEFRLLFFFMTHPERVYTRAQLLDEVWGDHVFIEERTVDVHIRRLRAALEPSGHDDRVETVRGTGYRFRGD